MQKEEPFFKLIGKDEEPFGPKYTSKQAYDIKYIAKSKTYKLRQLKFTKLASKFDDYKENNSIQAALDSVNMMNHLKMNVDGKQSPYSSAMNFCQINLE